MCVRVGVEHVHVCACVDHCSTGGVYELIFSDELISKFMNCCLARSGNTKHVFGVFGIFCGGIKNMFGIQ